MEIVSFSGKPHESFSCRFVFSCRFIVVSARGTICNGVIVGTRGGNRCIRDRNIAWRRRITGDIARLGNLLTISALPGPFFSSFCPPGFFLLFLDLRAVIGDGNDILGLLGGNPSDFNEVVATRRTTAADMQKLIDRMSI